MEHSIYGWIEAYARGLCDTDSFTGEITALCCRGPAMEGVSEAEALLLEQLCAGAQRFFDGSDAYPGRDQLDEAQFHRFFCPFISGVEKTDAPCGLQRVF